jgi:transcription initiation factor IIE alpha subunit
MKLEIEIYLCPDCFVPCDIKTDWYHSQKTVSAKCPKCKRELSEYDCEKVVQNVG